MTASKHPFSRALLGMILLICSAQGMAQSLIPGMKSSTPDASATQGKTTPADASPDARISAIQQRLAKLQSQAAPVQPASANAAEWERYRQMQAGEANALLAHVNALRDLAEARRTEQDMAAARKAWKGFAQKPPYDIALVDDWWTQVRSKTREMDATRVEQRLVDSLFEQEKKTLKVAQQVQRQADEQVQTSNEPARAARLRWEAEMAGLARRYSEARLGLFETLRLLRVETLANQQTERQWLADKAIQASRQLQFSHQELDSQLAKLAEQSSALGQKIERAEAAERQTQNELERMRKQTNALRTAASLQAMETARIEADAADAVLRTLRLMNYGTTLMQQAWQQRYQGMQTRDSHNLQQTTGIIESYLQRIGEWRSTVQADSDRVQTNLASLGAQLAAWQPELGNRQLAERQYQAYQAREAVLRQSQNQVEQAEGMLYNWQQVTRLAHQAMSWSDRLRGTAVAVRGAVAAVWNFEIIAVDDSIVVEGREIAGKRSVTLGKLVQVLLILVLGLWINGRLNAFARRRLLARYGGDENASLLWLRLASLGMGTGLVILALLTAHIPLTAFAFMGGALALGLGFGAQNILNNFISGMILLVEKPIKLGDIVEVDGIRGRVRDIGSRCCQVQRFDGIDMLIPHSVFLERTVTNWTLSDQLLRFSVTVGIAYGSPVETAMRLVREAVSDHLAVLKVPIPLVLLEDFGDNALQLRVDYWLDISLQDNSRQVASEIRLGIEKRFTEHGIAIPFPQRDIRLDSRAPIRVEMIAPT
jgi:small-conductance mechanosensitive channel/uncharacterized protein YdcH (DUF465 family)